MDDHVNGWELNCAGMPSDEGCSTFRRTPYGTVLALAVLCFVVLVGGNTHGQVCDLDGDADCDIDDIDELSQGTRIPFDPKYDLDGDGAFDSWEEINVWLESAGAANGFAGSLLVADANLDGTVNAVDLNVVGKHWQQSGAVWSTGDFNLDGEVNAADLMNVGLNWQQSVPQAAVSVPEPAAYLLGLICIGAFCESVRRAPAAAVSITLLMAVWLRR